MEYFSEAEYVEQATNTQNLIGRLYVEGTYVPPVIDNPPVQTFYPQKMVILAQ